MRRSVLSVLGTVALAAGAGAVPGEPASAATVAAGTYQVSNAHDDGCLTTTPEPFHDVVLGDCGITWTVTPEAQGAAIAVRDTSDCLAPAPRPVAPPRLWTEQCGDGAPHAWTFASAGRGGLRISAVGKMNRCLSATGGAHGPVMLLPCAVSSEETWTLTRVS